MKSILASNVSFNEPAVGKTAAAESGAEKHLAINSLSASPIAPFDGNNNLDATGYHHSVLKGGNTSDKTEAEQSCDTVKLKSSDARASSSVNDLSTQKLLDQIATTRRFTKINLHL